MVSPVVLGLRPPIPIAFYDPHQLHSYPCLYVHLPSSRFIHTIITCFHLISDENPWLDTEFTSRLIDCEEKSTQGQLEF